MAHNFKIFTALLNLLNNDLHINTRMMSVLSYITILSDWVISAQEEIHIWFRLLVWFVYDLKTIITALLISMRVFQLIGTVMWKRKDILFQFQGCVHKKI